MEITGQAVTKEKPIKKKSKIRFFVVLAVAILTLIIGYIAFRGTYLETMEIGKNYISVYWQNIHYMSMALAINFILIYSMVYFTNIKIKKGLNEFFEQEKKQMPKLLNKSIAFISSIIISSTTSSFILKKAMLCFNSAQFGLQDPVFDLDIGYFIFQKPFIELCIWYFLIAAIVLLIYTAIYYIVVFNMFFDGVDRKILKNSKLMKQITNFVMIIAILFAAFILVKTQSIGTEKFLNLQESENTYSLYGAGFTDVKVKLWGYRILAIVVIISVYLAIKAFKEGNRKKLITCIGIVPTYLVGLFFILVTVQALFVTNNQLDKEKQYIQANIKYTKNAYGINIDEISLNPSEGIELQDLKQYENVLNNITTVSKDILKNDLSIGQTAKGYYNYRDSKIGKYIINGKEQLVYISPREIISSNGTYNNKTYEYTHGYGAIITSATTTKENGTLNHIQKGFENNTNNAIRITQPRIYFGMQTNDTVVTNSKNKAEFDYPILNSESAENAECKYEGKAGLKLNFIDKTILAIKEKDLKLAFSGNVTQDSKILTNRNIIKRAQTIMPYLMYDQNPYIVITEEGKLIWVLDAYTVSNDYPYSQKTVIKQNVAEKLELNYIRNSVKVLIDSYDGTISFYITDRTDPLAMAYRNIYPDLFVDLEEKIPEDISQYFTYSEFLYNIQANIIARYHNIQPDVLYRSSDVWDIASHNVGKAITKIGTDISPYYTMVKLVNEEKAELGLVLPYTPQGRQNLISYLVGSLDSSGNNKLTLYKYQVDTNILGPMQLDTQIEQDETITKELECLNEDGIKVTKNMNVVPINHSLLYVEAIYTYYLNENDALPTLRKVVVAFENKVAIGNTLKQALNNLMSQNAVDIEIENTDTIEGLIQAIIKANDNLTNSNESNDWEMIGKDVKKLQEYIKKLEVLVEENNKQKNEILEENNGQIAEDELI